MVCLALELVGPWVVLGFSVGMKAFDELLLINVPWSQEFSGVLIHWIIEKAREFQKNIYFIFNLGVLSMVLYRWRSLEATVKIRLKTRSRRLKSKS